MPSRRTLTWIGLYLVALVVLAVIIIPLTFSILGGFRTNLQLVEDPVGLAQSVDRRELHVDPHLRRVLAPGPQQHGHRPAHGAHRAAGRLARRLRHRPLLVQGPRAGVRPVHARAAVPGGRGHPAAVHRAAPGRAAQQPARGRLAAGGVRIADRDHRDATVLPGDPERVAGRCLPSTGADRSASTGRSCSRCHVRC